jgi:hypothetical protein
MNSPATYVRFVVARQDEDPYWETGIFTAARLLRDDGKLEPYEVDRLNEVYDWFRSHVPCPPFRAKRESKEWSADAVAWFKDEATEPIGMMWEIVAILKEHGVPVRFFRSTAPGPIVYSDDVQIVAETPR